MLSFSPSLRLTNACRQLCSVNESGFSRIRKNTKYIKIIYCFTCHQDCYPGIKKEQIVYLHANKEDKIKVHELEIDDKINLLFHGKKIVLFGGQYAFLVVNLILANNCLERLKKLLDPLFCGCCQES